MNFKVGDKVKLNDPGSGFHKSPAKVVKVGTRSYDIVLENGLAMRVVPEQLIGSTRK